MSKNCLDSLLLYWRVGWGEGTFAGAYFCLHVPALGSSACPSPLAVRMRDKAEQAKNRGVRSFGFMVSRQCDCSTFQRLLVLVLCESPGVRVVLGRRNEEERV